MPPAGVSVCSQLKILNWFFFIVFLPRVLNTVQRSITDCEPHVELIVVIHMRTMQTSAASVP